MYVMVLRNQLKCFKWNLDPAVEICQRNTNAKQLVDIEIFLQIHLQGIEKDEAAPSQDCLSEFLNDTVIIRSLRCKFTLKDENCENSDSDLKSACDECAKILTSHSTYDQTN